MTGSRKSDHFFSAERTSAKLAWMWPPLSSRLKDRTAMTWAPGTQMLSNSERERDEKEECEMGNLCREDMLWESENMSSMSINMCCSDMYIFQYLYLHK